MIDLEKEDKYIVIKRDDLVFLSDEQIYDLNYMLARISIKRELRGKSDNKYWVCNQDEFYAHEVFEVIKNGEKQKAGEQE